ncbi:DUF6470 family protein [Paludicola sp. MB14-C6]|uniref:DUF6470 family protein n=1 Tax=Paludihabitans sp. MB14-C6 TaxID=3070656 RepID=UPI0027DE0F1E|nr:DUF6470 family protein [Paludicola sp. MB14-C6]WMJ24259.1 DUF6470 family protein [Paludicola sp. MB14-C6]
MGPLLQIHSVPFSYEMVINDARFEIESPRPSVAISRQKGGLQINSKPAQIRIDSTEARASMGLKSLGRAVDEFGKKGMQKAMEATAQIAQEGNQLMDTRNSNTVFTSIAYQRTRSSIDTMLGFIPSTPSKVSFDPHQLQIQYEMDKLSFDWRTNSKPDMNFVPASIEFKVKDYARLEIEYLGRPLYIPKSADPNYQEPMKLDVKG